jgi:hypothetical protein
MRAILSAITLCGTLGLAAWAQPGLAQEGSSPGAPNAAAVEPPAATPAEPAAEPAPEPPKRECHLFGVTWDGGSRAAAQKRSQNALKKTISDWRRKQGRRSGWLSEGVTIEAHRMRPNPYWRSRVDANLYYRPNARTATSYTVCWKGVISTAVCTSGAKVCK